MNHSTISHPKRGSNGDQFRNVPKSSFCESNILAMAILDDNELDVSDIKHQSRTLLLFHGKRTNRRNEKNSLHYYSVDRCAVAGFFVVSFAHSLAEASRSFFFLCTLSRLSLLGTEHNATSYNML